MPITIARMNRPPPAARPLGEVEAPLDDHNVQRFSIDNRVICGS
jgi:hypothetical protein